MLRIALIASLLLSSASCQGSENTPAVEDGSFSPALFADPPAEFRAQTRWWWPGASVEDATLREQLGEFAELGYGAVEIQPFMAALTNAALQDDERIRAVGDTRFLEQLRTVGCAAKELGLDWDLTFGSGWSTGGVGIEEDGARQLIAAELTLEGPMIYVGALPLAEPPAWIGATNSILLAIDGFDEALVLRSVLGAEVIDEPDDPPATLGEVVDLSPSVEDGTLTWDVPAGTHRVFAIYENRTLHFPAGGAYPGALEDARIIDHLDRRGVEAFLESEFGAWIGAVTDCPPRAVFVDSFELVGELPWTTSFGERFQASLGYDLGPFLPFVFLEGGESEYVNILRPNVPARYRAADERGQRAREDYESFRSAQFSTELIGTLHDWLQDEGIDLRLQAHGGYGDALDTYAMAEVPEAEGLYAGGSYDFLRLAASAAHIGGQRYVSNETLVSIGKVELSEAEARLVIGRAFSAGINRLVHHGNAYPYPHGDGERWFPFHPLADSAFTTGPVDLTFDIHPEASIWGALPALNKMSARLSYALSRGSAAPELAWLYPDWEVVNFPNFGVEPVEFESDTSKVLRRAGFGYSRISRSTLAASTSEAGVLRAGEGSFGALLVEGTEAAAPETLAGVQRAVDEGVTVIWLGEFPARADGLVDAEARDAALDALVETLRAAVVVVGSVEEIPAALADAGLRPSLSPVDSGGLRLSVERRSIDGGDLYFLFNESYEERSDALRIEGAFTGALLLDPETGGSAPAELDDDVVTVTLPGARGAVLWVQRAE
ncbi:MAG: glycosyl hydrolase [Polyangiales bacterium]